MYFWLCYWLPIPGPTGAILSAVLPLLALGLSGGVNGPRIAVYWPHRAGKYGRHTHADDGRIGVTYF